MPYYIVILKVNDVFPRLKSLALMGNPVWPAAMSRARGDAGSGGETYSSFDQIRSAGGKGAAVSDAAANGGGGGGGGGGS